MNLKSIQLALTLPGQTSPIPTPANFNPAITDVGSFLSGLLNIALYIAAFMAFYWLIWGAFQYIFAQGRKEQLERARERIRWAIIGLIVIFAAYFIARYAFEIFPAQGGGPF